ncbi:uncharacterized protein LOC133173376 [Saccostrea echinata]|uniref:uncharacterized protein LOC133173376 n=1 Tax=Saccostrea echinata TaxID=191078 RepID=UPI002A823244|nr:uncharacterized protein LOC133173376 [Saccostrea echinata]XP_061164344.1 uncharacterized protein LOC133173376 [Saccostrea echinata]
MIPLFADLRLIAVFICCIGYASTTLCQSGEVNFMSYPKSPFPQEKRIKFERPFTERPVVMYAIKMIDSQYNTNTRIKVKLQWVRPERFSLFMTSAYDSKLFGLGVSWMACP